MPEMHDLAQPAAMLSQPRSAVPVVRRRRGISVDGARSGRNAVLVVCPPEAARCHTELSGNRSRGMVTTAMHARALDCALALMDSDLPVHQRIDVEIALMAGPDAAPLGVIAIAALANIV